MRTCILLILILFHTGSGWSQNKEQAMDEMWGETASTQNTKSQNAQWFTSAKYAMFIHWGLFSQNANRWQGKTYYGIGEWLMYLAKTNVGEYEKVAMQFNPVHFNARQWVALAKDAGMKYIVITAKHHDGFAMFKSANSYNIVDATPFHRDPLKELAQACKEAGIGLGFYYSQFQDWHEINDWSTDLKKISFQQYFLDKCEPQVKELVTNYDQLKLMWFDTPIAMTREQSLALIDTVKKYQPQALINSRIGNGVGDYSTYGDHEIPSRNIAGLWEAVNTTNDSWGYAWYDQNWKGPSEIVTDLIQVVARGGNFMLNIGPKADGTIPSLSASFLRTAGQWVQRHGRAIYGTKASPWLNALSWGDITSSGNTLNLFVFDWRAGEEIWLPGLRTAIKSVKIKSTGELLAYKADKDNWVHIQLPARAKKELVEVITVELAGAPNVDATLGIDPSANTTIRADFALTVGCKSGKLSWMEKFGEWKHKTVVGTWTSDTSYASWEINVKQPGHYFVNIEYNAWLEANAGEWDLVTADGEKLRIYNTETTGSSVALTKAKESVDRPRPRFRDTRMGIIEFKKAGRQTLKFMAAARPGAGGIDLHAIYLRPVE